MWVSLMSNQVKCVNWCIRSKLCGPTLDDWQYSKSDLTFLLWTLWLNKILSIFWHSCLLMDPTKFCPFFTTSCLLMDPKTLCLLMDPNQDFPLSKSHVFWWTQLVYIFSKFPPLKPHVFWWTHYLTKTSCLLMDPKPHVF